MSGSLCLCAPSRGSARGHVSQEITNQLCEPAGLRARFQIARVGLLVLLFVSVPRLHPATTFQHFVYVEPHFDMAPGRGEKRVSLGAGKFIIPSDPRGFQDPKYWDQFFASRNSAFEWYGNFLESSDILCKYIKARDSILMIGSGNSEMSAEMYYTGLKNITNIDISQVVVDRMAKKYKDDCPDMKFIKDNVMNMSTVSDESLTVVLDKATFDALVADESQESHEIAEKICSEVNRVLKYGGRYICITLAQKHVLTLLVRNMALRGFAVRAHVINVGDGALDRPADVVFCFVFTKMKPGSPLICDMQLSSAEKMTRVEDVPEFLRKIRDHQFAQSIAKLLKMGRYDAVEGEHLKIFNPEKSRHCYNLYPYKPVIKKPDHTAACFIIPPGRSKTYLYGTNEGRKDVAQHSSAQLVMFAEVIEPPHGVFDFNAVKSDLTPHLRNFTPPKLFEKLVFLTDGSFPESESIVRGDEVISEGTSETTGDYRILQRRLVDRPDFERRLIFVDNPHVIQTEMRVSAGTGNAASRDVEFDRDYLPSDYQRCIVAALLNHKKLCKKEPEPVKILLVGLGGGVLTSFIHNNFPTCIIEALEIDPIVVKLAIEFFGLKVDERCGVHITDGVKFLYESQGEPERRYDVIIVDADTKDARLPLRCPPAEFISPRLLGIMRRLLDKDGMLAINILTRKTSVTDAIKNLMLSTFGNLVYTRGQDDELNSIAISLRESYFAPNAGDNLENGAKLRSREALDCWQDNVRRFNQHMDEKCGEILIDGSSWWKRVEILLTVSFVFGTEASEEEIGFLEKQKFD